MFDLYCGIGTIALALAGRAGEVWGVEAVPGAVADAERNAERNGIDNARFVAADVRLGVRPLLERGRQARRRGRRSAPRRPLEEGRAPGDRVRRDADRLRLLQPDDAGAERRSALEAGYRLRRVTPVDMFPQTPHVECVALLERT